MGSDLSQFRDIRLTKEDLTVSAGKSILDYFDFDKYSFDGTVSIDEWEYFFGDKFDLFLSYDSNLDEVYSSHIADIRANLEAKGLRVWFDNKHNIGEELRTQVAKAIDNSSVVVIIVTASYLQNVNGDNPKDRCRLEFEYASKWKPISNIVPVVIEAKVSDKRIWDGAIGFVFDSVPCLNLCPTGDGIVHTDELLKKILTITGTSMNEQLAQIDWMQTLGSSKLPSAPGKLALVGNKLQFSPDLERIEMLKKELLDWLIDQLKVVRVAEKCSKILYDAGILSVDRLQRKLVWNRRALLDLGFDQFDSEDIAEAFDETVKHVREAVDESSNYCGTDVASIVGELPEVSSFVVDSGHTVWQGKRTRISSSSMKQRRSGQVVVETGLPSERALRPSSALKPWAATPEPAARARDWALAQATAARREAAQAITEASSARLAGEAAAGHTKAGSARTAAGRARSAGIWEPGFSSGTTKWSDGSSYEGEFVKDKRDGQGVFKYGSFGTDGVYEGDFRDDLRHGFGVRRFRDETVYEGQFFEDQIQGLGVFRWPDGSVYMGEFAADQLTGRGVFRHAQGDICEGAFVRGSCCGLGVFKWADGRQYEGQFLDGRFQGCGVYRWPDGKVYEGEFVADKKHGQGVLRFADGSVYDGSFAHEQRSGYGVLRLLDGGTYEGFWDNDRREGRGMFRWPSGNVYEGDFKADQRTGDGVYRWPSGAVFTGRFRDDKKEGYGVMRYAGGEVWEGQWVNDRKSV